MNLRKLQFVVTIFFCCLAQLISAQNRTISGNIHSSTDKQEYVCFANVVVFGTTIGTMSDIDGNFRISVPASTNELTISAIGYVQRTIDISDHSKSYYNISMDEDVIALDEIKVDAHINPAVLLHRKIVRNKKSNDPESQSSYVCTKYMKHQFYLAEVDSSFRNNIFFRKHQDAFFKVGEDDSLASLPISFHEQISEEFKQKNPNKRMVTIKGETFTGIQALKESEITNFLGIIETNFYQNYLYLLDRDFVSPLSNIGATFYEYYIKDTLYDGNDTLYRVKFKPRRDKELVFLGYFDVNLRNYAVTNVNASITNKTNINFVKSLNISQKYQQLPDSTYFYKEEKVTVDFVYQPKDSTESQMPIRSICTISYSNINNHSDSLSIISQDAPKYQLVYDDAAGHQDSTFWNQHRAESLDSTESHALATIATVNDIGIIKLGDKLMDMGLNGYISTRYIDWGPWEDIVRTNELEGTRFALIGRTSALWTGRHAISGFLGYGTKDDKFKYGCGYAVEFTNKRYQQFAFNMGDNVFSIGNYNNNLQYLRENMFSRSESNIVANLLERNNHSTLYHIQDFEVKYEREWTPGVINRVSYNFCKHHSGDFVPFLKLNGDEVDNFKTHEFTLSTRLSWREKVLTKHFRRVYMGTTRPRIYLVATGGICQFDGANDNYLKLRVVMRHYFPVLMGKLMCNYEMGANFGEMPFPILEIPRGNESYGYARFAFNLMNNMEYVNDKFFATMIEYQTMGLIFNHIPLIKKMNIRENVVFKGMVGDCSRSHESKLKFPTEMTPLNGVYAEVGCGVTNIFKFLRLQYSWRLTDLDKDDVLNQILQASVLVEF